MKKSVQVKFLVSILIISSVIFGAWFLRKFFNASRSVIQVEDKTTIIIPDEAVQKDAVTSVESPTTQVQGVPTQKDSKELSSLKNDGSMKISNKLVNFGFQESTGRSIDTIIIHSSYDALGSDPFSISGIINEFKADGVAAHYLIGREGTIYRLVEDKNIAYHAGVSQVPDGRTAVNAFSVGVEMVNTKNDKFTEAQYSALNNLIGQLKKEYKIKYVLGHNQVAPDRKDDPWNFDWSKLN
jgi:AmpD protein